MKIYNTAMHTLYANVGDSVPTPSRFTFQILPGYIWNPGFGLGEPKLNLVYATGTAVITRVFNGMEYYTRVIGIESIQFTYTSPRAGATCVKCNLWNEYTDPNPNYICYECK